MVVIQKVYLDRLLVDQINIKSSGRIIGRVPNILIRTLAYFVVAWLVVVSVWSCEGRMVVRCWSRIVVCVLVK